MSKFQQISLVAAIAKELGNQHCNDWPRGGCQSGCAAYK
ncbi:hypothetical protein XNA1_4200013 [Xenorhabdus nematophila str. Anatoliense]|nr:hypothetical protein XNA1_4200013 [Xenorhabdus nematophila str. Anatoliense]